MSIDTSSFSNGASRLPESISVPCEGWLQNSRNAELGAIGFGKGLCVV